MPDTVCGIPDLHLIELATLREVAKNAVRMIHAFAASVMHRLAGIVLLVPDPTHISDCGQSIREVIEQSTGERESLALSAVGW